MMGLKRQLAAGELTFSKSVSISGLGTCVQLSGQVGQGADGVVVSGGLEAESMTTFARLFDAAAEVGGKPEDFVRITAYLTSLDNYADYNVARKLAFGETLPASTAVQVAGPLLGAQIEIDALVFIADDRTK